MIQTFFFARFGGFRLVLILSAKTYRIIAIFSGLMLLSHLPMNMVTWCRLGSEAL